MKILITGCSGFIGFHCAKKYLEKNNFKIYGIDNLDNYYDTKIKLKRLIELKKFKNFNFYKLDIINKSKLDSFFKNNNFDLVINLAAQAGVRYSLVNPKIFRY